MAAITGNDVAREVRWITNDTEPYKPDNTLMPAKINAAVDRVISDRTDALYNSAGALVTVTPITALSGTISIDGKWLMALAHAVCANVFQGGGSSQKEPAKAAEQEKAYDTIIARA